MLIYSKYRVNYGSWLIRCDVVDGNSCCWKDNECISPVDRTPLIMAVMLALFLTYSLATQPPRVTESTVPNAYVCLQVCVPLSQSWRLSHSRYHGSDHTRSLLNIYNPIRSASLSNYYLTGKQFISAIQFKFRPIMRIRTKQQSTKNKSSQTNTRKHHAKQLTKIK